RDRVRRLDEAGGDDGPSVGQGAPAVRARWAPCCRAEGSVFLRRRQHEPRASPAAETGAVPRAQDPVGSGGFPMRSMSRSIVIVAVVLGGALLPPATTAQQSNPTAQPATRWTDEQLRQAVAPARVGRTLTPRSWPDNARVAVCLSFDVDNESYLLARGETSQTTLSAADFGAETGLARILQMLDRYQVPASFFIPAVSALLHPQMIPAILKSGRHEVGVHGGIHEPLPAIDNAAEEERLLTWAIDYLTKAT